MVFLNASFFHNRVNFENIKFTEGVTGLITQHADNGAANYPPTYCYSIEGKQIMSCKTMITSGNICFSNLRIFINI